MKPGATLGLSHGFLLGVMKNEGKEFRNDINVCLVAPKGMGPSVRNLYVQASVYMGGVLSDGSVRHQRVPGMTNNPSKPHSHRPHLPHITPHPSSPLPPHVDHSPPHIPPPPTPPGQEGERLRHQLLHGRAPGRHGHLH